ncbi:unnamed protein product [Brugia timori]|uniref:Transposase n=1 Tax=Brugia timori TaxID=42155 RepID=A0A0R3RBN8_9BILA|nr:unnamed protein product [Brugia timori]
MTYKIYIKLKVTESNSIQRRNHFKNIYEEFISNSSSTINNNKRKILHKSFLIRKIDKFYRSITIE